MKINTDAVLLGALANLEESKRILDIGTGTGVIALMLAQRNHESFLDAIDIDATAFEKSSFNFANSLFHERLNAHHSGFLEFFDLNPASKYDLIVSNPPYFLNALQSPEEKRNLSKHTNEQFFIDLLRAANHHLSDSGKLEIIVPVDISLMLQELAPDFHLFPHHCYKIRSYPDKATIRHIISFSKKNDPVLEFKDFCIYAQQGVHSMQYKLALKDFFTIF
ncbi:MAG: methyltransferase [Sphingobacteriales bacterium]|nr:methyltransferase [Sphingobacteriales bacterium]